MHISMNYNDLILTSLEGWIVRESATQIELFSSNFQDGDQQQLFYFSQTCLTFDQPCCFLCLECAVQSFFATATNLTCQWVTSHTKKCRLHGSMFHVGFLSLCAAVPSVEQSPSLKTSMRHRPEEIYHGKFDNDLLF